MHFHPAVSRAGLRIAIAALILQAAPLAFSAEEKPYSILNTAQLMGSGGIDYVFADSDNRRLYVPRGEQVLVFDLDTLKPAGAIPNAHARGVAVDPKSNHAFCSSNPIVMWDAKTLKTIKTIPVEGAPDAIFFEPATEHIYVFSHRAPNATVLDAKDGSIVGTLDLGGAPEQAASDGQGHLYVAIEDKDNIAVVDVKTLKVTAHYDLGGKGGGPAGLGFDAKNHVLFAMCREPQNCVILNADDGKILTALPIGRGSDGAAFNPKTMEAFSSQGDGTLTVIKETSPTEFAVEQTVQTKPRAKTCTLDAKTDHIILIALEPAAPASPSPAAATPSAVETSGIAPGTVAATPDPSAAPAAGERRGGGRNSGPAMLDLLVVGR
ncbi:MAG: hypothetical protein QOD99_1240 [Chthoniobacter sp.]|jgi:DNA-binding beta-propeller fold protein YncE|nr:hypothetical protein [Chthoniobacter sp.]